ncbi:protein SPT2 homolog isoform X2 [Rhinatrema bivittatum]|uniref:protein SPT2 homolog isoform X2 n=1 Tax=Rhinatrema bivittatum TaxID=194408 RepID=UPI001129A175|nr:protein SPT2 homolog isoform X2 [Rhinatrema bivittatum]
MDFYDILQVASQKQDQSSVSKRYSLAVGPPKKAPKVKGVHSTAVQAFLRRKEEENRKQELEAKRKKEDLLAKRKELKHDRKAKAMASRTKDNFQGYNGIPIEEKPRKRRSRKGEEQEASQSQEEEYLTEDDLFEYSQTDTEYEEDPIPNGYEEEPPQVQVAPSPKAAKRAAPPMNFMDLLRLAEKKQFEPVEIKAVKKAEERPMTAEELREKEFLERKNKRLSSEKDRGKVEKNSSSRQTFSQGDADDAQICRSAVADKRSSSKAGLLAAAERKLKPSGSNEKHSRLNTSGSGANKAGVNRAEKSGVSSKPPALQADENGSLKLPQDRERVEKKSAPLPTKSEVKRIRPEMMANSGAGQAGKGSCIGPGRPSGSLGRDRPVSLSVPGKARPGVSQGSVPGRDRLGDSQGSAPRRSGGTLGSVPGRDRPGSLSVSGKDRPGGCQGSVPGRPGGGSGSVPGRPGSSSGSVPGRPGGGSGSVPGRPGSSSGSVPGRPGSGSGSVPGRPGSGSGSVPGRPGGGLGSVPGRPGSGSGSVPGRPGSSSGSVPGRPGSGSGSVPGKPGSSSGSVPGRPGSSSGSVPGRPGSGSGSVPGRPGGGSGSVPGRPGGGSGSVPGRPGGGSGSVPGRPGALSGRSSVNSEMRPGLSAMPKPKCTVVSETISSKNFVTRPSNGQINERRPAPHQGQRPMMRPAGPPLPPITSAYKRKIDDDDEEYDSEMDDFIDDGGESQDEISKHIREIFGYDKNKYKDESDYALRYMETSWKEQQKEESRSLRLGMEEDLEELKREEAELKAKKRVKKQKS